jgi:hypothetical protein
MLLLSRFCICGFINLRFKMPSFSFGIHFCTYFWISNFAFFFLKKVLKIEYTLDSLDKLLNCALSFINFPKPACNLVNSHFIELSLISQFEHAICFQAHDGCNCVCISHSLVHHLNILVLCMYEEIHNKKNIWDISIFIYIYFCPSFRHTHTYTYTPCIKCLCHSRYRWSNG